MGKRGVKYYFVLLASLLLFVTFISLLISAINLSAVNLWNATINGLQNSDDRGYGIAIDNNSNIYVVGSATWSSGSTSDIYLGKFNSSGSNIWNATINGLQNSNDVGRGIAIDNNSNIYIVGEIRWSSGSTSDIYLGKFNSSGSNIWNSTINGPQNSWDVGSGIAVDNNSNIYITGSSFWSSATTYDIYLGKFNSSGSNIWNATINGLQNNSDIGYSVAVDNNSNNIYVTGYSLWTGTSDIYLGKFNSSGSNIWNATINGLQNNSDIGYGVAVSNSNVYVTGYAPWSSASTPDIYLGKFNSSGSNIWNATLNGPQNDSDFGSGIAVEVNNNSNIYVVGYSNWSGSYDIYLGKFFENIIPSENSENISEWRMLGKDLNHTAWDGIPYTILAELNNGSVALVGNISSSPAIANGYVYIGCLASSGNSFYQLNASNVSQIISTANIGWTVLSSSAVYNGFVYVGGGDGKVHQLNASNISQEFANYDIGGLVDSSPAVANGYVYIGGRDYRLYQLNASNISQQIANYTTGGFIDSSPAVANGYVYVGSRDGTVYQLNAYNVSLLVSSNAIGGLFIASPAVYNGAVYIGSLSGTFYKLNASLVSQQLGSFSGGSSIGGSSPAIANGFVYFRTISNLFQLNASSFQYFANFTTSYDADLFSSPAIYRDFIYIGSDKTISQLNLFNISQQIANLTTEGIVSKIAAANGYVYFGNYNKRFYQLNASNISLGNLLVCIESWSCGDWSTCSGGIQTKTCTDSNNCATIANRPAISQSCTTDSGLPSTPPPINETQNIGTINSGQYFSVGIINPDINVFNITINANKNISNASITVSKIKNESLPQTFLSGVIYQAFNINTTLSNNNLNNVTMEFKVSKTWLVQQNYSYDNVVLYRIPKQNDIWQALTTVSIREDSNYYYFSALSPGFSTFVIFVGIIECTPKEMRCFNNELQSCAEDKTWTIKEKCLYRCKKARCLGTAFNLKINTNIIYAGMIIGIFAAIIVIFYFIIKNISRKGSSKTSKETRSRFLYNQLIHKKIE